MKTLATFITFALTTILSSEAQVRPSDTRSMPICPKSEPQFLEVIRFVDTHSADSSLTKGICTVLAPKYSWWETMPSQQPYAKKVEVTCSGKDLIKRDNIFFVKANVSYQLEIDDCRSNPGCYFTCDPDVFIRF
jgi:hypothetical protein